MGSGHSGAFVQKAVSVRRPVVLGAYIKDITCLSGEAAKFDVPVTSALVLYMMLVLRTTLIPQVSCMFILIPVASPQMFLLSSSTFACILKPGSIEFASRSLAIMPAASFGSLVNASGPILAFG